MRSRIACEENSQSWFEDNAYAKGVSRVANSCERRITNDYKYKWEAVALTNSANNKELIKSEHIFVFTLFASNELIFSKGKNVTIC